MSIVPELRALCTRGWGTMNMSTGMLEGLAQLSINTFLIKNEMNRALGHLCAHIG